MIQLIKALWRGFVGGPDFSSSATQRFLLDAQQLSLDFPDSNLALAPGKIELYFPHTSATWFEQHKRIYEQHHFVRVMTKNWMYVPPIALFPSCEYGMLSCQLRIKQTNKINVLDKQALSQYVTKAYDDYHYGPNGENTKIRQRTEERFSRSSCNWTQEEIEAEIAIDIDLNGYQTLAPAILKTFNQLTWVFYRETKNNNNSYREFYCLPLSDHSFLEIKFSHQIDRPNKHKKWAKHALASQERIMNSIFLDELPQEPAIEHGVD